jgi:hypothetical protein
VPIDLLRVTRETTPRGVPLDTVERVPPDVGT